MMSLASQMYDYYVKPYLGEKGQDLVEYALLLAIVVGIGFLIYQLGSFYFHQQSQRLKSLVYRFYRLSKNPCFGRSSLERRSIADWPFFQRT